MNYQLPELEYAYDALEPHIDARTMEIHHSKHHAGYVAKTNAAMEGQSQFDGVSIETVLTDLSAIPEAVRTAVTNNGGGVANHSLFWKVMGPGGGGEPTGALAKAIETAFGNYDAFKQAFTTSAGTHFGSGWAWLALDSSGVLRVNSTANQDTPLSHGLTPILNLDVWEHAYYLNYQNRRPDYIGAWWNVVNWDAVGKLFEAAQG
jgi:superoxide dismutase, Fe-Mn family